MSLQEDIQETTNRIIPQALSLSQVNGRIDQAQAFLELREITLTILAQDPNAILRLISLANNQLFAQVVTEFDLATTLKDALSALDTGPTTRPIQTSQPLGDAVGALTNLQGNIQSGFVTSNDVDQAKARIDDFLNSQIAPNVKSGGSQITTKSEAIRQIRETLDPLIEAHQETLRLLTQLELIFSEFDDADLRVLVGNTMVERSRDLIEEIQRDSDFAPTNSANRSTRHLSDLVTIKRLLDTFFSAPAPLDKRLIGDPGNSLRAQPVGTGTAALLFSTTAVRPLVTIETGASVVDITGNATPTSVDLLTSGVESTAGVTYGTQPGPYVITGGVSDTFDLTLDQGTLVSVTLTTGGAVPIATIVSDINTAVGSTVAFVDTFNGQASIRLESTTVGRDSHVLIGSGNANTTLGFESGALESGTDPTLDDVALVLTAAQSEYEAIVDDSAADTTLVSTSTGVFVSNILTDGGVADFLAAGVEAGDEVAITSGPNKSRTVIVLRVVASQVHLDAVIDDTVITYTIVKKNQKLQIESTTNDVTSALTVDSGNANTRLGFSGSESATGTVATVKLEQQTPAPARTIDSGLFSVVSGDLLTLELGPPATFTVLGLETLAGEAVLRIEPEVDNSFSDAEFDIESFGAKSFIAFIDNPIDPAKTLPSFIRTDLTINGYNTDLRVLEDAIAQAINDPTKAAAAVSLADDLLGILDDVTGLQFVLATYSAAQVESLDLLIASLQEHNLDRFLNLLLTGFLTQALAVTKDDASFSAQLQAASREANLEDLNV